MSDLAPDARHLIVHMAAMGGRLHRPLVPGEERLAVGLSQTDPPLVEAAVVNEGRTNVWRLTDAGQAEAQRIREAA